MKIKLLQLGDDHHHIAATRLLNEGAELSLERSQELLRDSTYLFVVALTNDDEIMGRVYGHILHRFGQTDLLLYEVDVLEEYQRQGAGRAMIEFLRKYSKEHHFAEMWVLAEGSNSGARGFYESVDGREEDSPAIIYILSAKEAI